MLPAYEEEQRATRTWCLAGARQRRGHRERLELHRGRPGWVQRSDGQIRRGGLRMRARRTIVSTFTVSGGGEFPFDMLRYDGCYPASEQEARKLGCYCQGLREARVIDQPRFSVELRTCHRFAPTTARWESFLWKVTHIDGVPV